jgi:hypothetical protein
LRRHEPVTGFERELGRTWRTNLRQQEAERSVPAKQDIRLQRSKYGFKPAGSRTVFIEAMNFL